MDILDTIEDEDDSEGQALKMGVRNFIWDDIVLRDLLQTSVMTQIWASEKKYEFERNQHRKDSNWSYEKG